jgi:hypothetical protein
MSMNLRLHLKLTCPRHPKYNPEVGQGAIKGGCEDCERILELYTSAIHVRNRVKEKFNDLASRRTERAGGAVAAFIGEE